MAINTSLFKESKAFLHIQTEIDRLEEDEHLRFDLSNDDHYAYWKLLFNTHNITQERYPKLHEHLDACCTYHKQGGINTISQPLNQSDDDGFVNSNAIAGLSFFEKSFNALAYSTINNGTNSTTLILQILDAQTHEVIGTTPMTDIGNGRYVQIETKAASEPRQIKAVLNYALVIDNTPYYGAVKSDKLAGAADVPKVIQPASKPEHKDKKNIMIALSRGHKAEDSDYWFHKGQWANNTIVVPFKGSVTFQSELLELIPSDTLFVDMKVVRAEGGEKKVTPHDMNQVYPWFFRSLDEQKKYTILEWNLPADGDGKTAGKAISFEKSPWVADTVTLFRCNIGVKTKNSPDAFVWAFVYSKQGKDYELNDAPGLKNIKPLVFYWHCLAKDTQIRLSDGTTKSIESIDSGDVVQINAKGDTLPVRATTLGHYKGKALQITTQKGDQITLSGCHVLITPDGPRSADEIKSGDTLITLQGNAQIKTVETIDFDDDLINLLLGDYDQLESLDDYGTTMFANNILVGDHQIQTNYLSYKRTHPNNILANISSDWHTDFQSSLTDQNT